MYNSLFVISQCLEFQDGRKDVLVKEVDPGMSDKDKSQPHQAGDDKTDDAEDEFLPYQVPTLAISETLALQGDFRALPHNKGTEGSDNTGPPGFPDKSNSGEKPMNGEVRSPGEQDIALDGGVGNSVHTETVSFGFVQSKQDRNTKKVNLQKVH